MFSIARLSLESVLELAEKALALALLVARRAVGSAGRGGGTSALGGVLERLLLLRGTLRCHWDSAGAGGRITAWYDWRRSALTLGRSGA